MESFTQWQRRFAKMTLFVMLLNFFSSFSPFFEQLYAAPTILTSVTINADGAAPWDATSYDTGSETNTGTDSSPTNGIVKAGSVIDFKLDITVNDEGSTNVFYTASLGSGFTWGTMPAGCLLSGSVTPGSAVTNGGRDILCNLGDTPNGGADPGTLTTILRVNVAGSVPNGTLIALSGAVSGDSFSGSTVPPSPSVLVTQYTPPVIPGTEPKVEIGKISEIFGPYNSSLPGSRLYPYITVPGSDGVTPGRLLPYLFYVRGKKGSPGLGTGATFELQDTFTLLDENMNPVPNTARLWTWGSHPACELNGAGSSAEGGFQSFDSRYPFGKIGMSGNASAANSAPNGGSVNCTQSGFGGPVDIILSGVDASNTTGPTGTLSGPYSWVDMTNYNYFGVYFIWYWIPLSEIDSASLTMTGANYQNVLTGSGGAVFDPTSTGGVSNYGTGYEPTIDNTVLNSYKSEVSAWPYYYTTGNTILPGSIFHLLDASGGVYNGLTVQAHSISARNNSSNEWSGIGGLTRFLDYNDGSRTVTPGQIIGPSISNKFSHYGTGYTALVCAKIDPSKVNLTGDSGNDANIFPVGSNYTGLNYENGYSKTNLTNQFFIVPYSYTGGANGYTTGSVIIEYATSPNGPNARDAQCGESDGPWYSTISDAGTGNITKVRVRYQVPTTTQSVEIGYNGFFGMQVNNSLTGGIIPFWLTSSYDSGSTWAYYDNTNPLYTSTYGSINPNDPYYSFVPESYISYLGRNFGSADRVYITQAQAQVTKNTLPSGITNYQAGKEITYQITPTLTGSSANGDLVIQDILPISMSYVYGSSSMPLDAGYPQANGSGNLVLQWTIPNVAPGMSLTPITFRAKTPTTNNASTVLVNKAVVSFPYDTSAPTLREATYSVTFVNNSQYGITKITPKPEVPVNGTLEYQLRYRNFTVLPNIPPQSIYIDIFPYNGDSILGARNKAPSTFTGSFTLMTLSGSNSETFEYTIRHPWEINPDPCHVSNQPLGSTGAIYCMLGLVGGTVGDGSTKWCTAAQFGNTGCPASLSDATAFRMTLPNVLGTDGVKVVDIKLQSSNNKPGNLYTNTAGTRRQNFNLYTASDQATIHVYGASVGDRVWYDANSDGIQDTGTGEYGIAGITLTLERLVGGNPVETFSQTTDSFGNYLFPDLTEGEYRMTVNNSLGLIQTYDLDGTGSAHVALFSLSGAENRRDGDFGYLATSASVGDRVWYDADSDGIQDSGEMGFSGVTVTLTNTGGLVLTTLTDENGFYSFTGLSAGAYTITVTPLAGFTQTYDLDGTGTAHSSSFSLGATQIKTDEDFGYRLAVGSLGDQLWIENGSNNTFNTGSDTPLDTIGVTLSGTDIYGNTYTQSTVTDASGFYLFSGLPAGNYTVTVNDPGYAALWDMDGVSTVRTVSTTLTAGQNRSDVDFSFLPSSSYGSLGDRIWYDANRDGTQDSGEYSISGVSVTLSGTDFLGNPVYMSGITDGSGGYLFSSLLSGSYIVTVSPPVGLTQTYDLDGTGSAHETQVILAAGQNRRDVDFGYSDNLGSVGDTVWEDTNQNGIQDTGEQGLSGVTLTLSGVDVPVTAVAVTDASGMYLFTNVASGTYTIIVTSTLTGMAATYDADGTGSIGRSSLFLSGGQHNAVQDFGYFFPTYSIGDTVWVDTDADGSQNTGEQGLSGVTVTLSGSDVTGKIINQSTITHQSGAYLFTGVVMGTYTVIVTPPSGYVETYDHDGTGSSDRSSFVLSADRITEDFGYRVPPVTPTTPVVPTGGSTSGGGVSSSPAPAPVPPAPSTVSNPTLPVTPPSTPVTPPKKSPIKSTITLDGNDLLNFVLPKKLLDTGGSLAQKAVQILRNPKLETMPQVRFQPYTKIDEAPRKLAPYLASLPAQDRNALLYVVIPTAGIIAPLNEMPEGIDRSTLISGRDIHVNPYLRDGVLHYPNSANAGELGNMIIAGHSSFWKSDTQGRYKTSFGNLPTVDAGEEVWIYSYLYNREKKKREYILTRYRVTASYNTKPTDVQILLPEKGRKLITLFTCTPLGGIAGRWVVRGELIEK